MLTYNRSIFILKHAISSPDNKKTNLFSPLETLFRHNAYQLYDIYAPISDEEKSTQKIINNKNKCLKCDQLGH